MASAAPALFEGILLGLGAAVPIGPVNVQIARRALRRGFGAGFALGCGAVTADVAYAIVSAVGVGALAKLDVVRYGIGIGGSLLLFYLGASCLREERRTWKADPLAAVNTANGGAGAAAGYATGLAMTLLNPMTLAFWFIAVPALAATAPDPPSARLPLLCAGVFLGTLSWVIFFSGVLSLAGRFRKNWWLALADAAGGAALLVFAVAALLSSLRSLL